MRRKLGRWILTSAAAATSIGGFLADWNRMHLFNPRWTPHAKFHTAWTILLGSLLGGTGLYVLWNGEEAPRARLRWGTLLPALYWLGQGASFVFPNARGLEAEFPDEVPQVGGVYLNERWASTGMLVLLAAGYLLASRESG